jgi:FemAB-related protein (PEP-CTERM system-associated)
LIGFKQALEKTFGYKSCYLLAEARGRLCGVLPLFLVKNLLGGSALVSVPFGVYGGVCADNETVAGQLLDAAQAVVREKGLGYLEVRNRDVNRPGPVTRDLYYTFIKELPGSPTECLEQLPRKTRAAARKGIGSGLTVRVGLEGLCDFYSVYAVSVRNLGSPVFPYRFLTNLIEALPRNTQVLMVDLGGKPIAGVFTFTYKDTVLPYYGGALDTFFSYQPNNFMYLRLMEWAVENGYRLFDFGRSKKDTGSYKFKELHGFESRPLFYQYYLNTRASAPDTSSQNPRLNLAIRAWKRMPVWLTKIVGPRVIRLTPP